MSIPTAAVAVDSRRDGVAIVWCAALLWVALSAGRAWSDEAAASGPAEPNLVKQANAPI